MVTLIGRVGSEPSVRALENGVKVGTFSLATSVGGYKKQDGTEVPEVTQWHNIVVWRGLAEVCEKFVKKGHLLTVFGSIAYREYEKDGQKRYVTDIIADDVVLQARGEGSSNVPPPPSMNDMPPQEPNSDLPF